MRVPLSDVPGSFERAARYAWRKRSVQVVRGLFLGLILGTIAGLAKHDWGLTGWFGVVGAVIEALLVFGGYLWLNLRGRDCEWKVQMYPSPSVVNGLVIELLPRDGRFWYEHELKACVVRDPSGKEARREGIGTAYTFTPHFHELLPRQPGHYFVSWYTKTGDRWLWRLGTSFDLDDACQVIITEGR